ncbi:hypothetical protein P3X46_006060 [Hevea brasiliensis]|uniref:F-box domain-containing protein n=1 Tax=Hevea brasiliensis TaxID=3981 RepID=A0ABQ9MNZ8_HEVBR|nr:F-box/kelch-repeat protein At3g06240-like [Hevea brasiliensis]KAJ9182024.1 hypothetical protein P3X46_006060 [Hevea brasiliensis]
MVGSNKHTRNLCCEGELEATVPTLPQEIILEVLLRLPVKSLCRFRCVSKSWRFIISSPQFAKTHLDVAFQNKTLFSRRRRIIFSALNLYSVEYESMCSVDDGDVVAVELDYPLKDNPNALGDVLGSKKNDLVYFKVSEDEDENPVMVKVDVQSSVNPRNWVEIWGSCNGLVCIAPDEDTLFLFNPSTGESKRILEESFSGPATCGVTAYGFGYDSTSDDYKVVRIDTDSSFSVYSSRTDSWRRIGTFPYDCSVYNSGMFLHGALHWVATSREDEDDKYVVSVFDLREELFWGMPAPDVDDSFEFAVGTLNGCLCILYSRDDLHDDFWVMREYGVGDSWARFSISLPYICMKPLCLAKNGEALLEVDGRLVQYNLEEDTYKVLGIQGIPVGVGFEADTYIESLTSPNGFFGREFQMYN